MPATAGDRRSRPTLPRPHQAQEHAYQPWPGPGGSPRVPREAAARGPVAPPGNRPHDGAAAEETLRAAPGRTLLAEGARRGRRMDQTAAAASCRRWPGQQTEAPPSGWDWGWGRIGREGPRRTPARRPGTGVVAARWRRSELPARRPSGESSPRSFRRPRAAGRPCEAALLHHSGHGRFGPAGGHARCALSRRWGWGRRTLQGRGDDSGRGDWNPPGILPGSSRSRWWQRRPPSSRAAAVLLPLVVADDSPELEPSVCAQVGPLQLPSDARGRSSGLGSARPGPGRGRGKSGASSRGAGGSPDPGTDARPGPRTRGLAPRGARIGGGGADWPLRWVSRLRRAPPRPSSILGAGLRRRRGHRLGRRLSCPHDPSPPPKVHFDTSDETRSPRSDGQRSGTSLRPGTTSPPASCCRQRSGSAIRRARTTLHRASWGATCSFVETHHERDGPLHYRRV